MILSSYLNKFLGGAILKKCAQKGPLITAWLFFENHKPEP